MVIDFQKQIAKFIPQDRIIDNPMLRFAYGTDASLYRMIPQLVVLVETHDEVQQVLTIANALETKITFRAAGTSLSGQAVTDQVLIVLSNNSWQNYQILTDGKQIRLEPGIIGNMANLFLKPYKRKIGPDPASINSCKIGGIAANNSSGMCCGTVNNSYNTLANIKIILANGQVLDTKDPNSRKNFSLQNPELIRGINTIKQQILNDSTLHELITHKFKIKNTTGYSLNAFLDYTDPIDVIAHLMIGSEGTLGFISEITYNTIAAQAFKAVSLVYCETLNNLVELSIKLNPQQVNAMELLDITSLNSIRHLPVAKEYLPALSIDTSAMLIEIAAATETELEAKINNVQYIINNHNISGQIEFSNEEQIYNDLWALRKGILPTIGGARSSGSIVIIEDIAVQIHQLPELVHELRILFKDYNYTNAAIFGHILDGNIHFVFTPKFDSVSEIERYNKFMHEMAHLVATKYQGSLKAEHGCGRDIVPFVELECGSKAYNVLWQIKNLLDPKTILNPDVILTKNPNIHLSNLKELNPTNESIDKCMECGFCETVCPSKSLTLTPRQRIATYRKMEQLKTSSSDEYNTFVQSYQYYGIDTCATTGLCKNSCPVGIDTGKFIKSLTQDKVKLPEINLEQFTRHNQQIIKWSNIGATLIGKNNAVKISHKLHQVFKNVPVYLSSMPAGQSAIFKSQEVKPNQPTLLYIPSCSSRMMADSQSSGKQSALQKLIEHLGYTILYPENLFNLCCGQVAGAEAKAAQLQQIIQNSDYPVLIDNSSCFYNLTQISDIKLFNPLNFIYQHLGKLNLNPRYNKIALHIDCSTQKNGNLSAIYSILNKCTKEIITPLNITCCGFAGDKGFKIPELNKSALATLAWQIEKCEIGVTFNRSCQIGLSHYGKVNYISLPELILNCIY